MRQLIDWRGLMRVGLHELHLTPDQFWRLSPAELRTMMGVDATTPPVTRARLAVLAAAFPDVKKGTGDGDN